MGIVNVALGDMGDAIASGSEFGLSDVHWVWWLAFAMIINSAISVYYYLRIGVVMFFEEAESGSEGPPPKGGK